MDKLTKIKCLGRGIFLTAVFGERLAKIPSAIRQDESGIFIVLSASVFQRFCPPDKLNQHGLGVFTKRSERLLFQISFLVQ